MKEISLVDLIYEILLKWRGIIVAMVIGGVLLGGYSYLQATKTSNENEIVNEIIETQEERFMRLDENLTPLEKNNVKSVIGYEKYIDYYDNSVIMQMDANQVPTMNLLYSVEIQNEKDMLVIFTVYSKIIRNGIVQWLTESGMSAEEAAKVAELITVKTDVGNQQELRPFGNKGTIIVSVIHADERQCKLLAEEIEKLILEKKVELENIYGTIEVKVIEKIYATEVNFDILTKQRSIISNAVSGKSSAYSIKSVFTPDELEYYEIIKDKENGVEDEIIIENSETTSTNAVTKTPSISIKFVILGMLLFAFLYIFFVFVMYLFNNKLRASDSMAEFFDITQLGVISTVSGKKKFLGFVDVLIIKLRDRNKRKFTKEESEEIVAVAIKMAVRKSGINEVSLLGCEIKKQTEDTCNNIRVLLEKEDIKVSVLDNILYNAETLEKLENVKNAVLIEKVGSTMYDEVAKEIEVLRRYNINVTGAILVD